MKEKTFVTFSEDDLETRNIDKTVKSEGEPKSILKQNSSLDMNKNETDSIEKAESLLNEFEDEISFLESCKSYNFDNAIRKRNRNIASRINARNDLADSSKVD